MNSPRRPWMFCLVFLCTWLSGCSKHYQTNEQRIAHTQAALAAQHYHQQRHSPPVRLHTGYFIRSHAVPISRAPSWLQRPVEIHAEQLPLETLLAHLVNDDNISIEVDSPLEAMQSVSLHYQGPLAGALRQLLAKLHASYQATPHALRISTFITRTFDIAFLPGAANYRVGQDQTARNSLTTDATTNLDDQQFSNLHGTLSLWQDLENTLNQLKSPQGKITVSESTTSVTISDHPAAMRAMARYIQRLNQRLSQQVTIKVQVVEVRLHQDSNFGLNWDLVAKTLGSTWTLSGQAGNATNLIAMPLRTTGATDAIGQIGIAHGNTSALLNALNQQGKVHVVTEPEVTTLNNQMAAIRITHKIGYIESVSRTENQFSNTSTITPGSVIDGFTLYLLPKIQGEQVFLQISSTMANLEKLEKVSTAPTELSHRDSQSGQYQAIQVPTVSQKSFNQRSLIPSGATLIIAGYQQALDQTDRANLFGVEALGGQAATSHHSQLVVLITPVILASKHAHDRYHSP